MNTKGITPFLMIFIIAFAGCKPNNEAKLNKLRQERNKLTDQIQSLEKKTGDPEKDEKVVRVTVSDIKTSTFRHFVEVQGRLDGEDNVEVFPQAQGIIDEVLVSVGQKVTKGQALAHIDKGPARDQLKALETQYQFAKNTYEKQKRLWDQKIGSEMQFLQARTAKEQLESQLAATRKQIDMMTIKSPINGTIEEVNVKAGQFTSGALPIPPFRVLNFNSLKVKAEVSESYSDKVKVGDHVKIYFPDLDREISAQISAVSRYINPTSRTFLVEARINTVDPGFKVNMIAVLKINDFKLDNAVSISVNYIQSDPQGEYVYVVGNKENRKVAIRRPVAQGHSYNGTVVITKGLHPGDQIITSGYLDLEPGEAISF